MNDKELQKAREVVMVVNRKGWTHIEDFIKNNLKPVQDELDNNFDLEKAEFNVLQAKKQAYKKILNFVDRRVETVQNQ